MPVGSFDFEDIASALATAFGAITAPSGYTDLPLTGATHQLPDNPIQTPICLVFPFRSPVELNYPAGYRRTGLLTWPVRFLFSKNEPLPQRMSRLYQWAQQVYATYPVSSSIDLGLGAYVQYALVASVGISTFVYGEIEYNTIELLVVTSLGEGLT